MAKRPLHSPRQRAAVLTCSLILLWVAIPASAGNPRWTLVYYRQYGNLVNNNNRTIESHLFREDGTKAAGVGVTNLTNSRTAIFGNTNVDGWNRITSQDNVFGYDLMIYDPGVATDRTPNFYWRNAAQGKYYSFETQWLYVSDEARVNPYPQTPVYHYDLVNGLNSSTLVEPPGTNSDAFSLRDWEDYQAQTFVVPPGINRIVSAQAFVIRDYLTHFQYRATIHEGGPTGPQKGSQAISRCMVAVEFFPVLVSWPIDGINAVSVTPGQTYALKLTPVLNAGCADTWQPGFNAYATQNDNYPGGMFYNGPTPVPDRDLLAIIVGVGYDIPPVDPAVISLSTTNISREVIPGENAWPPDTVVLSNTGGAPLDYTVTGGGDWLTVSTTGGRLDVGGNKAITLGYLTADLRPGTYSKTVVVADPLSLNSPQTVTVQVTVCPPQFAPVDFDRDGDVDQEDFGRFQACLTGQNIAQNDLSCAGARLDVDNDVDQDDCEIFFRQCLTRPEESANTLCNF